MTTFLQSILERSDGIGFGGPESYSDLFSWLNWIESDFAALRYFAFNGTDHRSHGGQDDAIGDYIRWRNQRAEPKREFAVNSKIRLPDYPADIA